MLEHSQVCPPQSPVIVKMAVTFLLAASSGREHVPNPVHPPDQPAKVCVPSAVAVNTTGSELKVALHDAPHVMPAGAEVTVPPPPFVTLTCAVPVPDSVDAMVPPGLAVAVNDTFCLAPTEAGVKRTPTMQLAPAPKVAGQSLDEMVKFALSDTLTPRVPVDEPPVFITVNVCAALIPPRVTEPNVAVVGDSMSNPGVSPDPLSPAVALPPGVALTMSVAGLEPAGAIGLKRTVRVQLAPPARVMPAQVPPMTV